MFLYGDELSKKTIGEFFLQKKKYKKNSFVWMYFNPERSKCSICQQRGNFSNIYHYQLSRDVFNCHVTSWTVTWRLELSRDILDCHVTSWTITWRLELPRDVLNCHVTSWTVIWFIQKRMSCHASSFSSSTFCLSSFYVLISSSFHYLSCHCRSLRENMMRIINWFIDDWRRGV